MTRPAAILILIFVLLAGLRFPAVAQTQPAEELKILVPLYRERINQSKYEEAIPIAEKIYALTEKKYGPSHENTLNAFILLGLLYLQTQHYDKAEDACKKLLEIRENKLGKDHLDVAKALDVLGRLYKSTARYMDAESCFLRSLAIREKSLGTDHTEVGHALSNLADLYRLDGRYAEAEPLFKRAQKIYVTNFGENHTTVAVSLNNLGEIYRLEGRYPESEVLFVEALAIYEIHNGGQHPSAAQCLNNLATLYQETGRYSEAELLYKDSLSIYENKFGKDHPEVARPLNNLAVLYELMGRYVEAEQLLQKSLEIRENKLGKDHRDVAISMNNLALLYQTTGRYTDAELFYRKSLETRKKALRDNHPDIATSLNNLGYFYESAGRYAEAEPLFKQSLEIRERTFGNTHPSVATSLNNLAVVCRNTGRYAEAESLYKRSLEITEEKRGKTHPDVAVSLNNLAILYRSTGRYAEAESLYKKALEIREAGLGKEHPDVATSLNNLAVVYNATGRYAEAESLYVRSLEIGEAKLGKDHPSVAASLSNLAGVYYATGRYAEAESRYKRTLEIGETSLGKEHPDLAVYLGNLAVLYAAKENYSLSRQYLYQGMTIEEKQRENVFLLLNERQQLSFIKKNRGAVNFFLALTSQHTQTNSKVLEDSLNAWLRWKGVVTEAQGRVTEACARSEKPEVIKKCDEFNNTRRTLASLEISKPEKMDLAIYRKTLSDLRQKKSALEAELGRMSTDFALEKLVGKADIPMIASLLPKGSAYLDFAVIQPYDFNQKRFEDKARCLAFVLVPEDPPRVTLLDLGDAEAIDRPIREYHKIIQAAVSRRRPPDRDALRIHLKALYGLVLEPLVPHIKGRKQLFVSPDGSLNLIPFEAFITSEGKYLVEEHSIQYVAAGRDIVRFKDEARALGKALILADPDYDLGEQKRIEVARQMGVSEFEVRGGSSRDGGSLSFKRLPDTRKEAEAIRKTMKPGEATCREDKEALQEVLFAAQYPKVLHIATHGYFLPDQKVSPQLGPGRVTLPPDAMKAYENPMLRSGIALAGANTSQREGKDYGMVSAEKVLGLRLKGTDLVVLSACETGVGEVQTGEGVFGLKRAFILSGARTVVMSLWSVPSKETTELMGSFYTKWSTGKKPKAEALREAKLELMKENPNPFFWGAFVMVGDPGK